MDKRFPLEALSVRLDFCEQLESLPIARSAKQYNFDVLPSGSRTGSKSEKMAVFSVEKLPRQSLREEWTGPYLIKAGACEYQEMSKAQANINGWPFLRWRQARCSL
jgi:hypothetical protein